MAHISYKELRNIHSHEKQKSMPTKIDMEFYSDLNRYLKDLSEQMERQDNPQRKKLYATELKNTRKIADEIYGMREKKIVHAALSLVRGGSVVIDHMIPEEKDLYDAFVVALKGARGQIFAERHVKTDIPLQVKKTKSDFIVTADTSQPIQCNHSKINSGVQPPHHPTDEKKPPAMTQKLVWILKDIPSFVGTDMRTYELHEQDILFLPEDIATLLSRRHMIKQIDI